MASKSIARFYQRVRTFPLGSFDFTNRSKFFIYYEMHLYQFPFSSDSHDIGNTVCI
jgi:hypothetical protein